MPAARDSRRACAAHSCKPPHTAFYQLKKKREPKYVKKREKGGGTSALTYLIRILIVVIFLVAVVVAFYRIAEVIQNNEEKEAMQNGELVNERAQHALFFLEKHLLRRHIAYSDILTAAV